jgi:hypothetical protein
MRLIVNEQAQKELIEMMQARGKYNPSYFVNLLIPEAFKQYLEIPISEGINAKPETTHTA